MAGVAEKLYPPIIGASIPAFYSNNGTVTITVPFSMNRAVSSGSIGSFSLKIKTAQSNSYIGTLSSNSNNTQNFINNRIVVFTCEEAELPSIKIGQYIKVQLAYNELDTGTVGYFSTVATAKYTSKPSIYIKDATIESGIPVFKRSYTGIYQLTEDKNERPYSYCFFLYDKENKLVESSGWQLHNINNEAAAKETLQSSETSDTYDFQANLLYNENYYIQYGVRTINDLEIYSPIYTCIEPSEENPNIQMDLIAKNVFEEGYISLSLKRKPAAADNLPVAMSIEVSRAEVGYSDLTDLSKFTWQPLKKLYFAIGSAYADLEHEIYQDFTVEQGVRYLYCFRQYNDNGVVSSRIVSDVVEADFEDMFLTDGKRHLKIRFNPKVTSFKATRQEQKIDTIGSKFPFIFRNGIVEYKEFPIGGLISYIADNNERFLSHSEDLYLLSSVTTERENNSVIRSVYTEIAVTNETYEPGKYYVIQNGDYKPAAAVDFSAYPNDTVFYRRDVVETDDSYKRSGTLDSIGYNMRAERKFKLLLMDWLSDGKIKLFRSPAEGNYLVRLMNISLTPEDKLGRMIHSFTATAYEVEELTYQNLINLGFVQMDEMEESHIETKSIYFKNKIDGESTSYQINEDIIVNQLTIEPAPSTNGSTFYIRMGEDSIDNKVLIRTGQFSIRVNGVLPNIYINEEDNQELFENAGGDLLSLVGDTILTYDFEQSVISSGEIQNDSGTLSTVYVQNIIQSAIGPITINNKRVVENPHREIEILQFYVMNFQRKAESTIYYNNGTYYIDSSYNTEISGLEENKLYRVGNVLYYVNNNSLVQVPQDYDEIVFTILQENNVEQSITYKDIPLVDLSNNNFIRIEVGAKYQLDYAFQQKVIEYKESDSNGE